MNTEKLTAALEELRAAREMENKVKTELDALDEQRLLVNREWFAAIERTTKARRALLDIAEAKS